MRLYEIDEGEHPPDSLLGRHLRLFHWMSDCCPSSNVTDCETTPLILGKLRLKEERKAKEVGIAVG